MNPMARVCNYSEGFDKSRHYTSGINGSFWTKWLIEVLSVILEHFTGFWKMRSASCGDSKAHG